MVSPGRLTRRPSGRQPHLRRTRRVLSDSAEGPPPAGPDPLVFLAGREQADWELLATAGRHEAFTAGDVLVRCGDTGRELLLLIEGRLSVQAPVGGRSGVEVLAPAIANEIAFLDGGPAPATLSAEEDGSVLRLSHAALRLLEADHPDLAAAVFADLGRIAASRLRGALELLDHVLGT